MLGGGGDMASPTSERLPDATAWSEGERLTFEKESLGFFITGHPLDWATLGAVAAAGARQPNHQQRRYAANRVSQRKDNHD